MKAIFSISIIVIFLASSCETSPPISDFQNGIINGKVTDKTTGVPIANATVYLKGYEITGSILTPGPTFTVATTISDADGNFSFDFDFNSDNGYFCSAVADQYFDYQEEFVINKSVFGGGVNVKVLLEPIAWLNLRCQNISPYDATDEITLSYTYDGNYPNFFGISVDTTICCVSVSGNNSNRIVWYVNKNGVETTYYEYVYCPAFDTTYYEILY